MQIEHRQSQQTDEIPAKLILKIVGPIKLQYTASNGVTLQSYTGSAHYQLQSDGGVAINIRCDGEPTVFAEAKLVPHYDAIVDAVQEFNQKSQSEFEAAQAQAAKSGWHVSAEMAQAAATVQPTFVDWRRELASTVHTTVHELDIDLPAEVLVCLQKHLSWNRSPPGFLPGEHRQMSWDMSYALEVYTRPPPKDNEPLTFNASCCALVGGRQSYRFVGEESTALRTIERLRLALDVLYSLATTDDISQPFEPPAPAAVIVS